jgi:hypothetical protein
MKLTDILFEAVVDIHEQSVLDDIGKSLDKFYGNSIPTASPAGVSPQGVVNMDPHVINAVIGFATSFIPTVGPYLSTIIGVHDANLYNKEGDKKRATIVAVFSFLPHIGSVVSKIPAIKNLGEKGMEKLATKLFSGSTKYTQAESNIINGINLNKDLISVGVKQYTKEQLAKEVINKGLMKTQQSVGEKGIEYFTNKSYDFLKQN